MNDSSMWILIILAVAAAAVALGWLLNNRFGSKSMEAMKKRADESLRAARRSAEKAKRKAILESKEEILRQRNKAERDFRSRKGQLAKRERDIKAEAQALQETEGELDRRAEALKESEQEVEQRNREVAEKRAELDRLVEEQNDRLEAVSGMTREEARRQLVANARAAIDEGVRRGVVDPDRVAIGGHSYGAFMTANLLAHSDLFRAGIARSGAYNRTLTPFGFQAEERTFWEAPEVYFRMSPFMNTDKIDEPILLIHGDADNNSGTFPIQSERYYHALKGLGKTARLVMLPHESHGYRSRESILHMLWEMETWLDRYVKEGTGEAEVSRR